ncbi:MAG: hypothetical protein JWN24_2555 [Phycisphaerales bacterium]|nr:hypothetical protein [Phycisphaerales bacterium]
MAIQTLTLAGKRFVLLPESEYRKLTGKPADRGGRKRPSKARSSRMTRQDSGDVAEADRRSSEASIPYPQVRKEMGRL